MISIGVLVAVACDLVEDAFLAWIFAQDEPTAGLWRWEAVSIAAWSKFLILLVVALYVLGGI